MTLVTILFGLAFGFGLWGFAEYVLHRFAMHHLKGRGLMSREHLEHHVGASWSFATTHLMSWAGMLLVGFAGWFPLGWAVVSTSFGVSVAVGWTVGYGVYEFQHAASHLWAPRGAYGRWLRRHHFHHHFGHPMANHGVTSPLWDHVFGTWERPDRVRVPRRLAMRWLVDEHGEIRPRFSDDYVVVGSPADATSGTERATALDRARAFASVAPLD